LTLALLCSQVSLAAVVHQNIDALPTDIRFDFIVAGGQHSL